MTSSSTPTPGAIAGWLLGFKGIGILALAGVTYVSSSGLIARLLEDLNRVGNRETPAILAVLVLEDFAMAAYLPVFAVLVSGGTWLKARGSAWSSAVGALLDSVRHFAPTGATTSAGWSGIPGFRAVAAARARGDADRCRAGRRRCTRRLPSVRSWWV